MEEVREGGEGVRGRDGRRREIACRGFEEGGSEREDDTYQIIAREVEAG